MLLIIPVHAAVDLHQAYQLCSGLLEAPGCHYRVAPSAGKGEGLYPVELHGLDQFWRVFVPYHIVDVEELVAVVPGVHEVVKKATGVWSGGVNFCADLMVFFPGCGFFLLGLCLIKCFFLLL